MYVSEDMRTVCFQKQRQIHIKIELLNFKLQVVDELSGIAIGSPSVNEDAESDVRRTCNISMFVKDSSFEPMPGGRIWLDKYVRIYFGIENIHNNYEVTWFNMGLYLINQPTYSYDATTKELTFEGVDLMAKLTGMRNGQLEGISYQIPAGSGTISEVVIDTITNAGFNNYIVTINEGENDIPYDIDVDAGGYVYDILTALRDIYANYQMYFDVDGVFHFEPIPTGADLQPTLTYTEISKLMTAYSIDVDFENVKNYIEVYGKTYEATYYASALKAYGASATQSGNNINITTGSTVTLADGDIVGCYISSFTATATPYVQINGGTAYPVTIADYSTAQAMTASATGYYMFQWNADNSCWMQYWGWGMYNDTTTYHIISSYAISLIDLDLISFTANVIISAPHIQFNSGTVYAIYEDDETTFATIPTINEEYIIEWHETAAKFVFIGSLQVKAIAQDTNLDSPFYAGDDGTLGKIRLVCTGGDYDNITTNKLAQDRADYELLNYCRLNDTLSITMLPVPFLQVYDLIDFPISYGDDEDEDMPTLYLIKGISTELSYDGLQTITAYRYYPNANSYLTISFDMQGHGTQIASQSILYAHTATEPTAPTETGYVFNGWYKDIEYQNPFNFDSKVRVSRTLYAQWIPITYTVSFNMQGHGTQIPTQTINTGGTATKPTDPTATGYDFIGWYADAAYTTAYDFSTVVNENKTIYARWQINPITVTFDVQGHGTAPVSQVLYLMYPSEKRYPSTTLYPASGGVATRPTDPVASGYIFGGWYTDAACTQAFDFSTELADNTTLYAKWTRDVLQGCNAWYLNSTLTDLSATSYINDFVSDGTSYAQIIFTTSSVMYGSTTTYNGAWVDESYRTIIFEERPTGDLLTWLQANATEISYSAEAWYFNDTLPSRDIITKNFISNNVAYIKMQSYTTLSSGSYYAFYTADDSLTVYKDRTDEWLEPECRTVIFQEKCTGDDLTYISTMATKVATS